MRDGLRADVWIDAPFTQADLESDAEVDVSRDVSIHGYVSVTPRAPDIEGLRDVIEDTEIHASVEAREVAEEDWAESWKEYFHVERYGEHIVVVPSWRTYDARAGDVVLALDPALASDT